jgi:hypothetical protein
MREAKAVALSRTDEAVNESLILRSFSAFTINLNAIAYASVRRVCTSQMD